MDRRTFLVAAGGTALAQAAAANDSKLPGQYFRLMDGGIAKVRKELAENPDGRMPDHYHPGALMTAAVLYAKQHAANPRYKDRAMLALALGLGDRLAAECQDGRYAKREDNHRDTYMWVEGYRLLVAELGTERKTRWRGELEKLLTVIARDTAQRQDRPAFTAPFGVSPNHTSLWTSTLYLAGQLFDRAEWARLAGKVMHRFTQEQSRDGYWGEHVNAMPTTAYDYLTAAGVALYYEHSKDPAALESLRRNLDFHKYFTYLDGQPVMDIDDRRRHAYISPWAQFGYSHFPDGRRYAEFLTGFYRAEELSLEHLGRLAQDALYYHAGPTAPIPQDQPRYWRQLSVPAAIRRTGPWMVCLSGLIATQPVTTKYYLDRQGSLGVFHKDLGQIITGANSKRQPELATFMEKIWGQVYHIPLDSRLKMGDEMDRVSTVYNTLWSDLDVPPPAGNRMEFHYKVEGRPGWARPKGEPEEARLTVQLCLKNGEALETGAGRRLTLAAERTVLGPQELGGWIRHRGWKLAVPPDAVLTWPVYPFSPYTDAQETDVAYAVGALAAPLNLARAGVRDIAFVLEA